jgi:hypothetical protein
MNASADSAVAQYFSTIRAALGGLEIFLADRNSPLYRNSVVGEIVVPYLARLKASFACWENRIGFVQQFRVSRAESGFPVFQNVLELENDRQSAEKTACCDPERRPAARRDGGFHPAPEGLSERPPGTHGRTALSGADRQGRHLLALRAAGTIRVAVNPKTMRPYYVVCWGAFDGTATLPMVYMATIEDSGENVINMLVTKDGKLNPDVDIPLPVGGLLNPELASRFDDFALKNSAYSLTPATIATNLDKDFPTLHPKQLRRIVLGPVLFGRNHREQRTGQRDPFQGEEAGKCLAFDLDGAGGLFQGRAAGAKGVLEFHPGAGGVPHRDQRSRGRPHGCQRLRETRAGAARCLSGALCRRRDRRHFRRLQGARDLGQPGDQRRLGSPLASSALLNTGCKRLRGA